MSDIVQLANHTNLSSFQNDATSSSCAAAAGILIGAANDLFTNGYEDEAIAMFDAAYSLLQQINLNGVVSQTFEMPSCYLNMVSRIREAGITVHGEAEVKVSQSVVSFMTGTVPSTDAYLQSTESGNEDSYAEAPDLYQDTSTDVGPRRLQNLVKLDCMNQDYFPFEMRAILMESIIVYNKGLVCHNKGHLVEAKQLYEVVAVSIQQMSTTLVHVCDITHFVSFTGLAMRVYNNLGVLFYHEHSTRLASCAFETSLQFATDVALRQPNLQGVRLEYATILSNLCRVNWVSSSVSDHSYHRVSEVLAVRSSILEWDHPDVASAHYNVAVADYARNDFEKAKTHLVQYLTIATKLNPSVVDASKNQIESPKTVTGSRLEAMPALVMLLLIQNKGKEDHLSQELLRGLRSLQEIRQVKGPNSPEVASVLNFVGTLLFHKSDYESALTIFQEELRLEDERSKRESTQIEGSKVLTRVDDTSVSVTCNNIGRILQELNRYQEAIYFYHRALSCENGDVSQFKSKKVWPPCKTKNSANLFSTVWYNLGLIHDKLRLYGEAIFAFEMSLGLRKCMLGSEHPDIACLLYNIGVLQMEQKLLNEASLSFREALKIRFRSTAGQLNDKHVVKTLEKLCSLYKTNGNCVGALETSEDILRLQSISPEYDDAKRLIEMGTTLRNVSELYHALGNYELAIDKAKESVYKLRVAILHKNETMSIRSEVSNNVEQLVSSLLLLGSLYHEIASPAEAIHIFQQAANVLAQQHNQLNQSFSALREVTNMLATCNCAPTA